MSSDDEDLSVAWNALAEPWRVAFDEAWVSWCSGSAGVGAVVTDPDGAVLASGRSRVFDEPDGNSALAGTLMAHAEMNALARLPTARYEGFTLYTTFEPCAMCATTMAMYHIARVLYAAADPVWDGVHDAFTRALPVAFGLPERELLGGPVGAFAHVLHLSRLVQRGPQHVLDAHQSLASDHLRVARAVVEEARLEELADGGGSVYEAMALLWKALPVTTDSPPTSGLEKV
jgi:tRNA(adenine34) deaminase